MQKTLKERIKQIIERKVKEIYGQDVDVQLTPPRSEEYGDYATNLAFLLSKKLRKPPSEIASEFASALSEELRPIAEISVVSGFINLQIRMPILRELVYEIVHSHQSDYGESDVGGGRRVLVEFVSANPTGPLNVVSARAATVGDSLVRIMRKSGYNADAEYYVNDAGGQIRALGESVAWRLGERDEPPQDGYLGEYLIEIAKKLRDQGVSREDYGKAAAELILKSQLQSLERFGVKFDSVVRESEIRASGLVDEVFNRLKELGLVSKASDLPPQLASEYRDRDSLVLRTDLIDKNEKPRVLIRSNGEPTYFMVDLAYHYNKFQRGYEWVIDLWGPDHHGYIPRMRAGLKGLGLLENGRFDVMIVQQVNLIRDGKRVVMSKRKGEFFTMDQLIDAVGVDAARFFFLLRSANAHLDFDIDLARKLSSDNPVYYVQYVHARISSLMEHASEKGVSFDDAELEQLGLKEERTLMKKLLYFPDVVSNSARRMEPHLIPHYLLDLAGEFHNYYQKHRIVDTENKALSGARLLLAEAVRTVVHNGLELIGVSAPSRM